MASQAQTVEQLFVAALDHKPEDRRAFLDRVCIDAPELRERVEELLLADEQAGSFLEKKLLTFAADQAVTRPPQGTNDGPANLSTLCPPRAGRFEPGQIIAGRFAVIRYIARGGMGEVYEVEDRFLHGVHVALKMILPQIAEDAGSGHRFEQEVLLARRITHPNLCPIYDISHCQEPPPPFLFLTMKLLCGETLASRLARTPPIPRGETVSIFRQMISGVAAIHDAGVIHRDIKPGNVMLDQSGTETCVSIMDFGLARLYESETTVLARGFVAGTPGYIAPELLRGEPPSQATDIFALGVLLQQIMIHDHPDGKLRGLSSKPSPALDTADIPPVIAHSVKEFLSEDPARRCVAFKQSRWTFGYEGSIAVRNLDELSNASSRRILTRRNFVIGSAVTACAATGGLVWKWNSIDSLFDPLPRKRFVALLNWPPSSDPRVRPILSGVIDAIASELARAEAFDRNLFVIAQNAMTNIADSSQLNELRESLGANIVLAASALSMHKEVRLSLSVLDSFGNRILRQKQIVAPIDQEQHLPERAVQAAAKLLNISRHETDTNRLKAGTDNPEAFVAFQAAESLRKQENDAGLNDAIEEYKKAIEIDPHYAVAQAKLSWAYLRLYSLGGDPAAMNLARENAESALAYDPNLVDGHLALAWIDQQIGDHPNASREMLRALSLDPSNPHTLVYQANFYAMNAHWSEAEGTFGRVLKLRPNYWLAHNELGMILNAQGKYQEALTEFRSASLAAPKNALANANVGAMYLQLGNLSAAETSLQKSYELNANDEAAVGLAALNRIRGKYPEAVKFAQEAVKEGPSVAGDWVELGDCCSMVPSLRKEAASSYKKAREVQEDQLRVEPKNGPGWMLLALCYAKSGQPESSANLVARAEALGANDLDSQLLKVRVFALLNRLEEALIVIARCIARGATVFQFQTMPDLDPIRADRRYQRLTTPNSSGTQEQ